MQQQVQVEAADRQLGGHDVFVIMRMLVADYGGWLVVLNTVGHNILFTSESLRCQG